MSEAPAWMGIHWGSAPLVVSIPHTGIDIPSAIEARLVSPWLARKDADWWIDRLYDFAADLSATVIRTPMSRTVIDVNRDPSGVSLYPGQATTALCPTSTFDGQPLYLDGQAPSGDDIARRRALWFDPYHDAVRSELDRLKADHGAVVLYDAHSIRSRIPRLFDGLLPNFNIGTNSGAACDPMLTTAVQGACAGEGFTQVTDGRFKGGYTTRHYGRPERGVHAIQMELACRGYMAEPDGEVGPDQWPSPYDAEQAAAQRALLTRALEACIDVAHRLARSRTRP